MPNFTAEEIVKALRICGAHDKCAGCPVGGFYSFNDCTFDLDLKAADLIDNLLRKLCSWCAVCPKEKRNPYDCEIIGTCKEGGGGE